MGAKLFIGHRSEVGGAAGVEACVVDGPALETAPEDLERSTAV